MIYLVAIILPWLALLLTGHVFQAIFSFILWLVAVVLWIVTLTLATPITAVIWLVLVAHAVLVINNDRENRRAQAMIKAMKKGGYDG